VAKDEVYNLRWSAELKDRVQKYAVENGYEDMASLIREAIQEKIDLTKEERLEKEVARLFQNPEFRRNLGLK
jgi:TorA maturation chaperone TorD